MQFCIGKVVLDAGCGTGYGSAYLAANGAGKVWAIDINCAALASAKRRYQLSNLCFLCTDLRKIEDFEEEYFDVIFASNSLEHIESIDDFFRRAIKVLKKGGLIFIAVPAPRSKAAVAEEMSNPYHLNIWSPRQWYTILSRYFVEVQCYTHILKKQNGLLHLGNAPHDTSIREMDFSFEMSSLEGLYHEQTQSAIFVGRNLMPAHLLPCAGVKIEMIDYSLSRPARPSWMNPFIWAFYKIAFLLRYQGVTALIRAIFLFLKKKASTKSHLSEK